MLENYSLTVWSFHQRQIDTPSRHLELLYEMLIIQAVKFDLNIIFKMRDFLFSIKESKLQWLNVYIFTLTIILNNYFSYLQLSATLSLPYILFLYSAT